MAPRTDFIDGARAVSPTLPGIVPFALVAGIAAVDVGFSNLQAIAMSIMLFAGASQLAALELIGRNAPIVVVVCTVLVVNLRFAMYSASIAPYLRRLGASVKGFGAYVLTDQAYAVSVTEFRKTDANERRRKWFYLGAAVTFWATWQISTITGVVLGASIPETLSLEFAVPLTFMALLFPSLEGRSTALTALAAGSVSVFAAPLPFDLGLVTAALVGIAVGVVIDRKRGTFPRADTAADDGPETTSGGREA